MLDKIITYDGDNKVGLVLSDVRSYLGGPLFFDVSKAQGANGQRNYLEQGVVIGKITSSGKARICTKTELASEASSATDLTVKNALPFVVGDSIKVNNGSATEITAIDYSTNVITVADAQTATANALVVGTDGSEVPVMITIDPLNFIKADCVLDDVPVEGIDFGKLNQNKVTGFIDSFKTDLPHIQFVNI